MRRILDSDEETQIGGLFAADFIDHADQFDISFSRGNGGGHTGEHSFAVQNSDHNARFKTAHRFIRPFHRNETFAVFGFQALCDLAGV